MLGLEGEKAMMVSYWFTAHILLAVPTFIFLTIVYLTKLGASKEMSQLLINNATKLKMLN